MLKKLWQSLTRPSMPTAVQAEPVHYKGYEIIAAPVPAQGQYRVSGTLRKIEGDDTAIAFERADTLPDIEAATRMTRLKMERFIDEQP